MRAVPISRPAIRGTPMRDPMDGAPIHGIQTLMRNM